MLTLMLLTTSTCSFTYNSKIKVPNFTVATSDDEIISLKEELSKRPIYLVFWATWCLSCLREVPNLKAINEKYGDNIVFIAIECRSYTFLV